MDDPIEIVARAMAESSNGGRFDDEAFYATTHRQVWRDRARAALLALREPMSELRDWMAIWDRVCDAADPDDAQDPPPWEEVRKVIGPDMDPTQFPSADYFDGYMRARLVDLVRDLLHALQTQEKGNA